MFVQQFLVNAHLLTLFRAVFWRFNSDSTDFCFLAEVPAGRSTAEENRDADPGKGSLMILIQAFTNALAIGTEN